MNAINVTYLRKNIYSIFDKIIQTGIPQIVERDNFKLKIILEPKKSKLDNLIPRKGIAGNPDDLIHFSPHIWTEEKNLE